MDTLALIQGDLYPAPGGYLTFSGVQKIQQDISLALLEDYGSDPLHPKWGSILKSFIGLPLTDSVKQQVVAEITRVVNNYILVQNAQIVNDSNTGALSKMSTDDVVSSVSAINVSQNQDGLNITLVLNTVSNQQVVVNQVISA